MVIGGGVAGLLAAAVACKHFDHVVLLDRDDLLGGRVEKESVDEASIWEQTGNMQAGAGNWWRRPIGRVCEQAGGRAAAEQARARRTLPGPAPHFQ